MDSTRFILITALFVVLMLLYQAWQNDYGQKPAVSERPAETPVDVASTPGPNDRPDIPQATPLGSGPEQEQSGSKITGATVRTVTVNTDNYRLAIALQGAGIVKAELHRYPVSLEQPDQPFVIMDRTQDLFYITQGGLLSKHGGPTHADEFSATQDEFIMAENQDVLEVTFYWTSGNGIAVKKVFAFRRGSYQIDVRYEINNDSKEGWNGQAYSQLKRNEAHRTSRFGSYTFTGAVISSPETRYKKISFDDISEEELSSDINNGWAAMIQHYFLTALLPSDQDKPYHYYTRALSDGNFAIGMLSPVVNVEAGDTAIIRERLYIGPKVQRELERTADGLELTVDYGFLWFIAKPLFWLLGKFHEFIGNWGWSIILLTFLLKLVFYPLSAAQYRSMANMRKVQPRLLAIRDRYKDDKARLNQAMMQLYKEEKINPMGGCLPILVQIPVFLALYWVLLESVELRQAGFIFWLQDLSSPDPFYVLPLLMGLSMFVMQKINPAPLDPVQAKVMSVLPVVFTVFFAFFQSGLVLYWVVNNVLSIAQQWLITRNLERPGPQPKQS